MATQKTFSTFEQQVDRLCNEKHLLIPDKQYAEITLKHIGYFPLMGGYKHLFRIPLTKKNTGPEHLLKKSLPFMNLTLNYENYSSNIFCK